nr:immunoglobulin light chain junction region [Macaca mulatta]
CLQGYSSPSRF